MFKQGTTTVQTRGQNLTSTTIASFARPCNFKAIAKDHWCGLGGIDYIYIYCRFGKTYPIVLAALVAAWEGSEIFVV